MATDDIPWEQMTFKQKVDYWRRSGGVNVTFQGGQALWHDTTWKQHADREVAKAAADGRTLTPVDADGEPY